MSTPLRRVSLLERLRLERGLTIGAACKGAGVTHKTIVKYERGLVPYPHPGTVQRLAAFYEAQPGDILVDLRTRALDEAAPQAA